VVILALALVIFPVALLFNGHPPLWLLMTYIMMSFFCVGILFGNQNSLAMEPLGHLAGIGAAIVGSLSTMISMPLGTFIGQNYNGTVLPLIAGLAIMSALALFVVRWANQQQQGPINQEG